MNLTLRLHNQNGVAVETLAVTDRDITRMAHQGRLDETTVHYAMDAVYNGNAFEGGQFSLERAAEPQRGDTVRVFKGRKVPVGTVGVVRWTGVDNYGNDRVGLAVENEPKLVYTSADNVEVLDAAPKAAPYSGPSFAKGDKVTLRGTPGTVFWSGPDKRNAGKLRVGVKLANGQSEFVDAGELGVAAAPPAPKQEVTVERAATVPTDLVVKHEPQRLTNYAPARRSVSDIIADVTSRKAGR